MEKLVFLLILLTVVLKILELLTVKNPVKNPTGKYWSPGCPEDVPLQHPQDVP